MKLSYIAIGIIGILMYNVLLIQRDQKLFKAYDTKCAEISHPRCIFSK